MSNYIPNHRKKSDRLQRVKGELQRLIARGASRDRLLEAAAEVRDCRIRVLRARKNENPETSPEERAAFLKLEEYIAALQALSAETVLAEFLK